MPRHNSIRIYRPKSCHLFNAPAKMRWSRRSNFQLLSRNKRLKRLRNVHGNGQKCRFSLPAARSPAALSYDQRNMRGADSSCSCILQMGAPAFELKLCTPNQGGSQTSTSAKVVRDENQSPRQNDSLKDTTPLQ